MSHNSSSRERSAEIATAQCLSILGGHKSLQSLYVVVNYGFSNGSACNITLGCKMRARMKGLSCHRCGLQEGDAILLGRPRQAIWQHPSLHR